MFESAENIALAPIAEVVPADYFAPLDLAAIFRRNAPLEVDLGCGDGSFLAAAAAANQDHNFLGVERLVGRVQSACGKITRGGLTNARILRLEGLYTVQQMLPANSVAVFYLMFPDPWPKRRHWNRRVVTEDFLVSIHRALIPNGIFRITTDQRDYFDHILRQVARISQFSIIPPNEFIETARSTFEERFRASGTKIHRLVLRKVSDSRKEVASQ